MGRFMLFSEQQTESIRSLGGETPLQLWIEGVEPALSVRHISVREQLSDLFSVTILARSPRPDLDLEAMLFRPACLSIHHHDVRRYSGVCASAEQVQAEPTGLSTYALRVVPRLWLATLRHNYRIFQHLSVHEIITAILDELSVAHTFRIDEDAFPELEYRVQYGESDHAFLSRMCEDAGLSFFFEDNDNAAQPGDFKLTPYEGGLMIQAGPKPQIGDAQANRWPRHYV